MKATLVVFAKEPRNGEVKTRLASELGLEGCRELYEAFLKDTFRLAKQVLRVQRIVAYLSGNRAPIFIKKQAKGFAFLKQKGANLGERLHNAFQYLRGRSSKPVVIIGSDSPNLPAEFITRAFEKLLNYDVVVGPSRDGGYYLIGLKEPCEEIFVDIDWSTKNVFKQTLSKIRRLKKTVHVLPLWYDVDDQKSLKLLMRDFRAAVSTKKFFYPASKNQ